LAFITRIYHYARPSECQITERLGIINFFASDVPISQLHSHLQLVRRVLDHQFTFLRPSVAKPRLQLHLEDYNIACILGNVHFNLIRKSLSVM